MLKAQEPNSRILLVIDPALRSPAIEAVNCISKILGEFRLEKKFATSHLEYFCPYLNKISLSQFLENKNVGAVISLGSHANITENHPFVSELIQDLNTLIFSKQIPFLGVCFSHQMLAHIHGLPVGFLKDREHVPLGKHHGFRTFDILHPKLAILATKMSAQDYFSGNQIDKSFQNAIQITKNWTQKQWESFVQSPKQKLKPKERDVQKHIETFTLQQITCHARHEQEVLNTDENSALLCGATSSSCEIEALVHAQKQIYSFQTHLETEHERREGYMIIKNFLYSAFSSIIFKRASFFDGSEIC